MMGQGKKSIIIQLQVLAYRRKSFCWWLSIIFAFNYWGNPVEEIFLDGFLSFRTAMGTVTVACLHLKTFGPGSNPGLILSH